MPGASRRAHSGRGGLFQRRSASLLLVLERIAASGAPPRRARFGLQRRPAVGCWARIACTVAGYFAVAADAGAARLGQARSSFGQLHLVGSRLLPSSRLRWWLRWPGAPPLAYDLAGPLLLDAGGAPLARA